MKLTAENALFGHTSPETAYVVDDYPYGYRLRCSIRYWIETVAKKGDRLCSQTTNPKVAGEVWNKPKKSTYSDLMAMYLDEEGHVQACGISHWDNEDVLADFLEIAGEHLSETQKGRVAYLKGIFRVRKHVTVTIHQGSFTPEEQAEQDQIKADLCRIATIEARRALGEPLTTTESGHRLAALAERLEGEGS